MRQLAPQGIWFMRFAWLLKCLQDSVPYPELGQHVDGGAPSLSTQISPRSRRRPRMSGSGSLTRDFGSASRAEMKMSPSSPTKDRTILQNESDGPSGIDRLAVAENVAESSRAGSRTVFSPRKRHALSIESTGSATSSQIRSKRPATGLKSKLAIDELSAIFEKEYSKVENGSMTIKELAQSLFETVSGPHSSCCSSSSAAASALVDSATYLIIDLAWSIRSGNLGKLPVTMASRRRPFRAGQTRTF